MRGLVLVPMTIADAYVFVNQHHRHLCDPGFTLFALGAGVDDRVVAAATVGRPVARMLCDGWTCELTRLASDGTRNACSFLYGRAWRAAQALGWKRMVTYTLPEEGGASLRAAGLKLIGPAGGGSWSREQRPRVDKHPTQGKLRWEKVV